MPNIKMLHERHTLTFDGLAHNHKGLLPATAHDALKDSPRIMPVHFYRLPPESADLFQHRVKCGMPLAHACQSAKIVQIHESDQIVQVQICCHHHRFPG